MSTAKLNQGTYFPSIDYFIYSKLKSQGLNLKQEPLQLCIILKFSQKNRMGKNFKF